MAKVIVYSTPTCSFCIRLKQFLKDNSVEFEEVDVASDKVKAQEMIELSGQTGVPVTTVDGQVVVGYDITKLKELLSIE